MNTLLALLRQTIFATAALGLLAVPARSVPVVVPDAPELVVTVATDCYAIGMQEAAREGGQLARATPETRGGQTVCVIVILMPAKDGQRPRRTEKVVPM